MSMSVPMPMHAPTSMHAPMSAPAYKLAICEIFHPSLHGQNETSSPEIAEQFLVYTVIDLADFYSNAYLFEESSRRRYIKAVQFLLHNEVRHPTIRAYNTVSMKYCSLQIVQTDILTGLEEVAYLKTFWLKLVQRRWKKIYKARQDLLKERMTIRALTFRARTGKWPRSAAIPLAVGRAIPLAVGIRLSDHV